MGEKIRNGIICILLIGVLMSFVSCATTQGIERRAKVRQARIEAKIARIKSDTLTQPAPAWVYPYIYPNAYNGWNFNPYFNNFYGQRPLVIRRRPKSRRNNTRPRTTLPRHRNIKQQPKPRAPRTGTTGTVIRRNQGRGPKGGGRKQH